VPVLPLQAPVQQKGFYILDCYRFSLRDYLSDLLKPQNIEHEILNVEVKPSKFFGSLFYGSILKMSRANLKNPVASCGECARCCGSNIFGYI
jgi:hypothetical protein